MSCRVGRRCSQMWRCYGCGVGLIGPLAWEPPYAKGGGLICIKESSTIIRKRKKKDQILVEKWVQDMDNPLRKYKWLLNIWNDAYTTLHLSNWQRSNNSALGQKHKLVRPVGDNLCLSKSQIHISFDPAIPFRRIYSSDIPATWPNDLCPRLLPAAQFAIAKDWKQFQCPSKKERWYSHTIGHCEATNRIKSSLHNDKE